MNTHLHEEFQINMGLVLNLIPHIKGRGHRCSYWFKANRALPAWWKSRKRKGDGRASARKLILLRFQTSLLRLIRDSQYIKHQKKHREQPLLTNALSFLIEGHIQSNRSHDNGIRKGQSKTSRSFHCLADLRSLWQIAISQCQLMTAALWLINCSKNDQENYS